MAPYKTTTVLNYILECSLYILGHIINAYCCPVYIFESSSYISDISLNAYHMLVDLFLNGVWWCYNHRVWPILVCIYMFFPFFLDIYCMFLHILLWLSERSGDRFYNFHPVVPARYECVLQPCMTQVPIVYLSHMETVLFRPLHVLSSDYYIFWAYFEY